MRATLRENRILSDQIVRDRIEVVEAKEEVARLREEVEKWKSAKVRYQKRAGEFFALARQAASFLRDAAIVKPEHADWLADHPDLVSPAEGAKPIEDVFQEIASEIPEEELDKLPADLSSRVDEIVYGQPPHAAPEEERARPEYDAKDKAEKLMAWVGPSIVLGDAVAEAEKELSYAYRLGKDDGERIKEGAALLVRCHFEVAEEALGEDEARRRFHERFDRYLEEVRALANEKEGGSHGTPVADPARRSEAPRSSAEPADTSTSRG